MQVFQLQIRNLDRLGFTLYYATTVEEFLYFPTNNYRMWIYASIQHSLQVLEKSLSNVFLVFCSECRMCLPEQRQAIVLQISK